MPSKKVEEKENKDREVQDKKIKDTEKEEQKEQEVKDKEKIKDKTNVMQSKNTTMVLVLAITVVVIGALLYFFRGSYIAAMVNGKPIWRWSLAEKLEESYGSTILDQMILESLVYQEAKKEGVTISPEIIDTEVQAIESQVVAQGSTLDAALATEGLTLQSLKDQIELQKIAETIAASDITVTDEEIDAYIEENKDYLDEELSDDELRLQVAQQLESQKQSEAIQTWVSQLQTDAAITNFIAPDSQ